MAEGRMLKKAISTSRRLADLQTDSARMLYTWIIPHLDVEGRFYADPAMIKGAVVPRVKTFTVEKINDCIRDMAMVGLIILYEADGDNYLQLRKFEDHQNIKKEREAPSKIPAPAEGKTIELLRNSRPNPENSGVTPDQIKNTTAQEKLREVKLREVNTRAREDASPVDNSNLKTTLLKKENEKPLSQNTHGERWTEKQGEELEILMEEIKTRYGVKYHQQVYVWLQSHFNRANPDAVLYCLRRLIQERLAGKSIPAPGRWLESVIAVENAKHEARESEQQHEARKAEETRDVAKLISGIGVMPLRGV